MWYSFWYITFEWILWIDRRAKQKENWSPETKTGPGPWSWSHHISYWSRSRSRSRSCGLVVEIFILNVHRNTSYMVKLFGIAISNLKMQFLWIFYLSEVLVSFLVMVPGPGPKLVLVLGPGPIIFVVPAWSRFKFLVPSHSAWNLHFCPWLLVDHNLE